MSKVPKGRKKAATLKRQREVLSEHPQADVMAAERVPKGVAAIFATLAQGRVIDEKLNSSPRQEEQMVAWAAEQGLPPDNPEAARAFITMLTMDGGTNAEP